MIKDVFSYLYVNAKIMAKEGKFIPQPRWEDLWGCASPAEMVSFLEGTDYFFYLSEGAISGAREIEKAFLEELADLGRELCKIIPKGGWPIKDYLLKKWDVMNLRTALRGIHGNLTKDEMQESFVEGGEVGFPFFRNLIDAEGMEDLVARLAATPYHSLSENLGKYNETGNLFFLESSLDKVFWEDLWFKVLSLRGSQEFKEFVEVCVETHNLRIVFRAKNDALLLEDIEPCLISECTLLNEVLAAFDEEEVPGLIALLEDTPYFEPLVSAQHEHEKTGSGLPFEDALDRLVLQKAEDSRKKRPFGPGPLIGFLVSKETEVKTLLTIARSTEVDLDRNELRASLAGK